MRPATLEDIPAIIDLGELLHVQSDYSRFAFDRDKLAGFLSELVAGAGVVFVVERFGEVVGGIAGAVAEFWFSHDTYGFEYVFFVHPEHRHGITALRLLSALEAWCKLRGALELRLQITTGIDVEKTAEFYGWAGYRKLGVHYGKEL